jgi:hypothetical protein
MFFVLKFELILSSAQIKYLRRAPEKYIAGAKAALDCTHDLNEKFGKGNFSFNLGKL